MRKNVIFAVGVVGLLIAGAACVYMGLSYQTSNTEPVAEETSNTIHVDYDLAGTTNGQSNLYQHYKKACEDVIARMYIPDTAMETPIVDSDYYFRRDLSGKYSTNGTPLVLTTEHFMKPNHNAIIYGHRLYTGDDFGMLKSYLEQDFYDEHPDIYMETDAGESTWKIISVFPINVATDSFEYISYENLSSEKTRNYFLSEIKRRNAIDTGDYSFHDGDEFITLSTCHYETSRENGRLVVVAVRK